MRKIFIGLLLGLLFTACANTQTENVLRIAHVIDDGSPESGRLFEGFRDALSEHLGMTVQFIEGASHLVGIEAMRAGNLDIMWGSPFVYLLASRDIDVVRLAVTDSPTAVNKTVFITGQDDIHTLYDLRGRSFAFISPASTSGFLYPMYHLMNMFDMTRDEIEAGRFFSTMAMSGSQTASIMGVVHGDFDAAAVGNLNLQIMIDSGLLSADDVRIIGDTEIIPFPGYIARAGLGEELINSIREFLLEFADESYFDGRFNDPNVRFVEPDEAQIRHMFSIVQALDFPLDNE